MASYKQLRNTFEVQNYTFTIYQTYTNKKSKKTSNVPDVMVNMRRNQNIMQYPTI